MSWLQKLAETIEDALVHLDSPDEDRLYDEYESTEQLDEAS